MRQKSVLLPRDLENLLELEAVDVDEEISKILSVVKDPVAVASGDIHNMDYEMLWLKNTLIDQLDEKIREFWHSTGKVGVRDLCYYNRVATNRLCCSLLISDDEAEVLEWFKDLLNKIENKVKP